MAAGCFNDEVFDRAMDILARRLALFRDSDEPTENEKLMAGHLAGALAAADMLVETLKFQRKGFNPLDAGFSLCADSNDQPEPEAPQFRYPLVFR